MLTWGLALLFFQHVQLLDLPTVTENPYTTAADLAQGRRLYAGRCAGCHGPEGNGGKGANLAVPELARGSTDIALWRTIRFGIPETEMPGSLMTPREIWQVAAFVKSLGAGGRGGDAGDAQRGAALVAGKAGCLGCHRIGAKGANSGPPLSDTGRRRSASYLRAKLLDPGTTVADDFRAVEASTRDGRTLRGIRVGEDTWSIQFRDAGGAVHSYWKQDLTNLRLERKTPMPSYRGRLSDAEIHDVVAYLTTLGGVQ